MTAKIGILLAQLGTPDAPTTPAVRSYLSEFLRDQRVVDLNPALWWLILNGVVLRTRPSRSAALYRKIWTAEGSPLLVFSASQAAALQERLSGAGRPQIRVEVAMRYGKPSTAAAVERLCEWGAERILLFPMYPQYSAPTTASVYDAVFAELPKRRFVPALRVVPPYYDHPLYIEALAESARDAIASLEEPPDRILLSFHGIPQRYADLGDPYPQHCRATAELLSKAMGWGPDQVLVTFQSRFGREPWLQPYTDETLKRLGGEGVRRLAVICPGFIADCLETIDEIGNLGLEQFQHGGGESLHRIACLNDRERWIDAMTQIATDELQGWI